MASTLAIEKINLNGTILTSNASGVLTVNGDPVEMDSSINNIQDKLFIKGYCPLSFYSRMPVSGRFLSEVYLNESFMATGWLVTCSSPGSSLVSGRFYSRHTDSVANTTATTSFALPAGSISNKGTQFATQITSDKIIGIDITNMPYDIESVSINLLGYFAGAGKFDRVPTKASHYSRGLAETGNAYSEDNYVDYDSTFTGINVYSSTITSGVTGVFYYKNKSGIIPAAPQPFGITSGSLFSERLISYAVPAGSRVGFDISGSTGAYNLSINLVGYFD